MSRVACPDCKGAGKFYVGGGAPSGYWHTPDDMPHYEWCGECDGTGEIEDYSQESESAS